MTIDQSNPAPGIYEGTPYAEYHLWNAVRATELKCLLESPLALANYYAAPEKPNDGMILGSALDCVLLEDSMAFSKRYVCGGMCEAKTIEKKAKDGTISGGESCTAPGKYLIDGKWKCGKHGDEAEHDACRIVLTPKMWNQVESMTHAVERHPRASRILRDAKHRQISLVWIDAATGLKCKARLDLPTPERREIWDLKKSRFSTPHEFIRQAWGLGYDVQIAHYIAGANALDIATDGGGFVVATENDPPGRADCYCVPMSRRMLEVGKLRRDATMLTLAALPADRWKWPGVAEEFVEWEPEQWMLRTVGL